MTTNYDPILYGELLMNTLPGVIETEEENERALAIVNDLMNKGEKNLSPEEHRLLDLLVQLIEAFEDTAYPMTEMTPAERLRELMADNNLKQKDLIDVFGTQSTVSAILSGTREITKEQAKSLARRFTIPVEVFI